MKKNFFNLSKNFKIDAPLEQFELKTTGIEYTLHIFNWFRLPNKNLLAIIVLNLFSLVLSVLLLNNTLYTFAIPFLFLMLSFSIHLCIMIILRSNVLSIYTSIINLKKILNPDFFITNIISIVILFIVLLNISSSLYDISYSILLIGDLDSSLFYYTANNSIVLSLLLILFSFSFTYTIWKFNSISNINLQTILFNYIFLVFLIILSFYCNNYLLLIFLLESLLLVLLNLLRYQNYAKIINSFIKSNMTFIIAQGIATVIYCYGLSLLYIENPTLTYFSLSKSIEQFDEFYLELHKFTQYGGFFILFALLIKVGLGPLGLWTISAVKAFDYTFLALYFCTIKSLYFTIFSKLLAGLYGKTYILQGLLNNTLNLNNSRLIEYAKVHFGQVHQNLFNGAEVFETIINESIAQTEVFRFNLNLYFLILCLFSVFVGSLGLLLTIDVKRFLVYSSILNYGFSLYPLISGYSSAISYCTAYVLVYSFVTFFVIVTLDYLNNSSYSLLNLVSSFKTKPLCSLFLVVLIASLSGLPPFIGFFLKLAVLLEIFYLAGTVLGIIFIFFILLSSLGYIRLIKFVYSQSFLVNFKNDLIFLRYYITTHKITNLSLYLFFLIAFVITTINVFFGLPALIYCEANTVNVFNSIIFDNINSFYNGSFVEKPLFDRLYNHHGIELDIFSTKVNNIINNDEFIQKYLSQSLKIYVEKQKILTGAVPSEEECSQYKEMLIENLKKKSLFYTQGSGLEYSKKF